MPTLEVACLNGEICVYGTIASVYEVCLGIQADMQRWGATRPKCQILNFTAHSHSLCACYHWWRSLFDGVTLESSAWWYHVVLILVDYATWYPEAVPLHNILTETIALCNIISPWESEKRLWLTSARPFYHTQSTSYTGYWGFHPSEPAPTNRRAGGFNKTRENKIHNVFCKDKWNWGCMAGPSDIYRGGSPVLHRMSLFEWPIIKKSLGLLKRAGNAFEAHTF